MINIPMPMGHVSHLYDHLQEQYDKMGKEIGSDEVVIATAYLFGGDKIVVEQFGYHEPSLTVHGLLNGEKVVAYIDKSSAQVIFSVMKKVATDGPKTIGFVVSSSDN